MALPDSFLEQLKDACEIEDVVGGYVALKQKGRRLVGLCPFHGEKTPSFTVFPDTQSYYCFGCGAGGDAVTFIRGIENLDYMEAVRLLADKAGIPVPEDSGQRDDAAYRALRERIYEINKEAANYYYKTLVSPRGKEGLEYLKARGLSAQTIKKFGLGFAPPGWDMLVSHLTGSGRSAEDIHKAGLCARDKNGRHYDTFRNRIIFPILDLRGNILGFGGRVIDKDDFPKYLNTSDTPVFKKSRNLFSLNNAKGEGDRLILAEGYMDVIALYQAGFKNAVATLGTALTAEQARLISRYAGEVIICYDADEAGRKATDRAIPILTETGVKVRVLRVSGGKDPDEFIRAYGADKFSLLIDGSGNQIEYKLSQIRAKYNLELPDERLSYLKEAAAELALLSGALERDIYAGELAKELEIEKTSILSEASRIEKERRKKHQRKEQSEEQSRLYARNDKINPDKKNTLRAAKAEEGIICTLFQSPELYIPVSQTIGPEEFITAFNRRVYELFGEIIKSGGTPDAVIFSQYFTVAEMGALMGIISKRELLAGDMDTVIEYSSVIREYKNRQAMKAADSIETDQIEEYIKQLKKRKG